MSLSDYRYTGEHEFRFDKTPTDAPSSEKEQKEALLKKTEENIQRAADLQEMLYAEHREGLVIAIQARDAAGKDSLIKHVLSGLNPAGIEVHSFKGPSSTELSHDYLWRINAALPPRGTIGVFNRSQYEDVLVARVHKLEETYQIPARCVTDDFYPRRYRQLRDW